MVTRGLAPSVGVLWSKQRNLRHLFTWLAIEYGHPHPYTEGLVRYAPVKVRPSTLAADFIRDLLSATGGGRARTFDDARDDAASLAVLIPRYVHGARQHASTWGFGPGAGSAGTLPWVPSPPEAASDRLATYLTEAAASIDARVEQLADAVVRDRPGWARSLGNSPEDPERYAVWRRQIKIIAAYRDASPSQHNLPPT